MDFKLTKSILNLRVSTAETVPTAPGAENDVVILSSVPMKNWMLSPDAPTGAPRAEGDVWLQYSVKGDTFNVLKNQVFEITFVAVYQFVGEVWNKVDAAICRDGEWKELLIHLFKNGTGAVSPFSVVPLKRSASSVNYVDYDNNAINFHMGAATYSDLGVTFTPAISGRKTLYMTYTAKTAFTFGGKSTLVTSMDQYTGGGKDLGYVSCPVTDVKTTVSLDISTVEVDLYVIATLSGGTTGTVAQIYDIWAV